MLCCWRFAVICDSFCTTFDDGLGVGCGTPSPHMIPLVSPRHIASRGPPRVVMTKTCDNFNNAAASDEDARRIEYSSSIH